MNLDIEKDLIKAKKQILNYRMNKIYQKIDNTIEDLNFSKRNMAIEYVEDNDFVVRLYKKITKANNKVIDLVSMIKQAQDEGWPYDKIVSNYSEPVFFKYDVI